MDHDYAVDDNVLIYKDDIFRKRDGPVLCPFKIVQVYTYGVVQIRRGIVTERINIRRLSTYTTDNCFSMIVWKAKLQQRHYMFLFI